MILARLILCAAAFAATRARVVVGLREPVHSLSPFAPATIDGYRLTGLIFEPLAKVDPATDDLEAWLARAWTRAGRTLRVTLRADVRFQDGTKLSANDVVETFARFRDPKNDAATWAPLWQDVLDARKISDLVVEFTAERWTFEMVRNLLTNLRVQPAGHPAKDLIGTGPFRANTPMTFTRFDEWWHEPRPNFDLTFKTVPDEVAARGRRDRGEIDFFPATRPGPGVIEAGPGDGIWIDLNVRRPPFDDRRVREAVLCLWDRAELNQKIYDGRRQIALDAFAPTTAHHPPGRPTKYDPARAERLLSQAGWRRGEAGWRRGNQTLAFGLLVANADQDRWATLFQNTLAQRGVGVRITRRALDGEWWRLLRAGEFDAAAGGGAPAPTVNADAWRSTGAYNLHGLKEPRLDELLTRQDDEFDPRRRATNARRMIEMVRESLVQLPGLIAPHALYLASPRVRIDPARPEDYAAWRVSE